MNPYLASRIAVTDGCWTWTGPVAANGYGTANLVEGRTTAHRAVYRAAVGPIPSEMHLDHQCHNADPACAGGTTCMHRRCVNPAHLRSVSPRINILAGKTQPGINARKANCPAGHPYDGVDPRRGWRTCSLCIRTRAAERRRARGAPPSRAHADECAHGHRYTLETTRWSRGYRMCKTCDRDRATARRLAREASRPITGDAA